MRRAAVLLATGFGIGFLPLAPATWASFATALALWPILPHATLPAQIAAIVLVGVLAIVASGEAEQTLGHDAHPIVIDEVAGMLVSVWAVPGIAVGGRGMTLLVLAFLLFRVFDILKPWPVDRAQRLPGGWGVVMDDVLAGIYVNVVLQIVGRLWT